ncbi:MAG: FtsX-like permease family protein [Oligoflexia bacterium]|nr:FtsX-like permease family protein [Oligoflexia bacterium]
MDTWIKLAWREIINNKRFALFFVFNLTLGLLGFVILDSFKVAFDKSLDDRSRNLLSADLSISARRQLTPEEERAVAAVMPPGTLEGRMVEMYSMAASERTSRLVEVAAIDDTYPFYGEIELKSGGKIIGGSPRTLDAYPTAWIDPELSLQLGVKVGQSVKIGDTYFRVGDTILSDSGTAWRGFSLASRLYLSLKYLDDTHLVQKGSTAYFYRLYRLPQIYDAELIGSRLNLALTDPAVQVRTHRKASEEVGRLLGYLNDYLGLVALVALFLANIGSSYLFRSFLSRRLKEIAILSSLGVTPRGTRAIYLFQIGILGILAGAVTLVVSQAVLPTVGWVVTNFLQTPLELKLTGRTVFLTLLMSTVGSLLVGYRLLKPVLRMNPALLFQESADPSIRVSFANFAGFFPIILAYWTLSVWQSHSVLTGSLFVGIFLASAVLLAFIASAGLALVNPGESEQRFWVRASLRSLRRSRLSSISCFVAIGLGSLLLNLIPQIQVNLNSELTQPGGIDPPSLFLFDIQENQVGPLQEFLKDRGLTITGLAPMVRARLTAINDQPFVKDVSAPRFGTREEERESRSRNRGFNLSWRDQLSESESIVEGRPFSGKFNGSVIGGEPAEISVERQYAKRIGVHIGDVLEFDVQGLRARGRIVNLRKVRWAAFQPNFFVLFQPGVLEDAPKTYLATIPRLDMAKKLAVQDALVSRLPNISMVDVGDLVVKILEIFRQMAWAIQIMAYLSLFSGFVVLFSIANHQASMRSQETNLLKVLGAKFFEIRSAVQLEFGLLGFGAAMTGTALSYLVSFILSRVLFEGIWIFTWRIPFLALLGVTALSVVTATIATRRVLREKPIRLLQESA